MKPFQQELRKLAEMKNNQEPKVSQSFILFIKETSKQYAINGAYGFSWDYDKLPWTKRIMEDSFSTLLEDGLVVVFAKSESALMIDYKAKLILDVRW